MLYRDLMLHLNVKDTSVRRHVHSLDVVRSFEFGETFQIVLRSGSRVCIRHLDTLLECIRDEFKVADTYDFTLYLSRGKSFGEKKGPQVLALKPRPVMGMPWNRNIYKVCNQIRDWVTEYTLSEEWPQEVLELEQWLFVV